MAVSLTTLRIRLIEGNWWPTSTQCQCLWSAQQTRCVISMMEASFHYTDTGEARQGNLLCPPTPFCYCCQWKLVEWGSQSTLLCSPSFLLCLEKEETLCVSPTTGLHHSYNNVVIPKWDSHPPSLLRPPPMSSAFCSRPPILFITCLYFHTRHTLSLSHTHA